jgi:hypothetical protein
MLSILGYVLYVVVLIILAWVFGWNIIKCFGHTLFQATFLRAPHLYKCSIVALIIMVLFVWSLLKCPLPEMLLEDDKKDNKYCPKIYDFYKPFLYILIGIAFFAGVLCFLKTRGYLSFLPVLKSCDPFDPNKMDIWWNVLIFIIFILLALRISKAFVDVATNVQKYD